MARSTHVRKHEVYSGTFECAWCMLEVPALVSAQGWGQAREWTAAALVEATEDAEREGNAVAARTLQFVRCPRCGKRDPKGRSYRIQVITGSLVLGALVCGAAILFGVMGAMHEGDRSTMRWAFAIGTLGIAALFYAKWRRPWVRAEQRTRIDPADVERAAPPPSDE